MVTGRELTRIQRLEWGQRREEELGITGPSGSKAIDLAGVYVDATGDLAWRAHPTGLLVHGPGSSEVIDRAMGKGRGGSALWAVISSYIRAYKEPQISHYRGPFMQPDESEVVTTGQLAHLLRRPHPHISMNAVKTVLRWTQLWEGRAHLIKRRTGEGTIATNVTGAVAELWPVPARRMKNRVWDRTDPRFPMSNGWTDYYAYAIAPGHVLKIPPENVIEFTMFPDPVDPRNHLQPIREIAEEIATDAQLTQLYQAVITNLGVPGIVVAPKLGDTLAAAQGIPKPDRDSIRDGINARTMGEKRGSTVVLSRPVDFYSFATNLEVLKLDHLWRQIETRISGAIGWPAVLAGLGVGLDDANRATIDGLKEHATESVLVPAWTDDGECFTRGLERDFGLGADEWIGFGWNQVRALQQDENELWKRAGEAWARNELTIAQHHKMLGLEVPPGVDPTLRKADIESGAQLAGLLGPAVGKALLEGIRRKGADQQGIITLAANHPALTNGSGKAKADAEISEADVDAAVVDWDAWARTAAPQYVGMLEAESDDDEEDEGE